MAHFHANSIFAWTSSSSSSTNNTSTVLKLRSISSSASMISAINLLKASLPLCYRSRLSATASAATRSRRLLRPVNPQYHGDELPAGMMSLSCSPAQGRPGLSCHVSPEVPRAPPPRGPSRPPNDLPGIDMPPEITPPPGVEPPAPGTPVPRPGPDFPRTPIPSPPDPEIPVPPPPGMDPPTPTPSEVRPRGSVM